MMLPTSVRRIATAAPQSPLLASFAPTVTRATTAFALTTNPRCNQRRRYSSSKPSSPNGSSKDLPDGQVTASPAQSSKQGSEKRRRKAAKDLSSQNKLPSVPSTQNVPQEALALSTFFSLHRPISVTHSFPRTITDDAFAQIFASRVRGNNTSTYSDVMSTLSQTVDQLEQPMQGLSIASQQEGDASADAHKISLKHPDGTESNVYVQLNHMSGQFLPFRPPPLPQPLSAEQQNAAAQVEADAAADAEQPQTRIYKAMFTLEETIDENGDARIVAHSPQLVEDADNVDTITHPRQRPFLERMALREIHRNSGGQHGGQGMLAISVKRQRKLKMKKKKYKKLMRRTRNERRKLDRI